MKKTFKTVLLIALMALCGVAANAQERTMGNGDHAASTSRAFGNSDVYRVRLRTSGTLHEYMNSEDVKCAHVVVIDGTLNNDDIRLLRTIGKRSSCVDHQGRSADNYVDFDLSRARIRYDEISDNMFESCRALRRVILPDWTRVVGRNAFEYCSKLEEVIMPSTVNTIGEGAFNNCTELTRIALPNSVKEIGSRAFFHCDNLRYITLPGDLRSIGSEAFGYTSISSMPMPLSLESIGDKAFSDSKLEELNIPRRCKINGTLGSLKHLRNISVMEGNPYYTSSDGALFTGGGRTLYYYASARTGRCHVPDGVTSIGKSAFYGSKVSEVSLPESCREIGAHAFRDCAQLTSISFSEHLQSIGEYAFYGCSRLPSFALPEGITTIKAGTFRDCTSMASIELPSSLTSIDKEALRNCQSLRQVDIPSGVTVIGDLCFRDCVALQGIILPSRATSIGAEAFRNCKKMTEVQIPGNIATISKEAFLDCHSLRTVMIDEGVTQIGDEAFKNCDLSEFTLPSTMLTVGKKVVDKNKNLQRITVRAANPPALSGDSEKKVTLFVPAQAVGNYKQAKNWKNYKNIQPL